YRCTDSPSVLVSAPRPPSSPLFPYTTLFRSERHLRLGEPGVRHGVDEVAGEGQFAAAGVGRSVHRCDNRNRAIHDGANRLLDDGMLAPPHCVRHAVALLQVGACAEALFASSREHETACLVLIDVVGSEAVTQV